MLFPYDPTSLEVWKSLFAVLKAGFDQRIFWEEDGGVNVLRAYVVKN